MRLPRLILLLLVGYLSTITASLATADEREQFFEAKIRPVLAVTCFRCHGDAKTSGELRVDSRDRLLAGGESGPAIVPGKPEESLLIQAISRKPDVSAMPPEKEQTLRPDQVADFVAWVKAGAVWPEKSAKFAAIKYWAFEPLRDVKPQVHDSAWGKTSIDGYIRARQEPAGVRPAPAADKVTLLRRATFDLTGLPPTPAEVEAFLRDDSPGAFEAVVDRLLRSPAYGEKWGRHWLDVVRYADTAGETADYPAPLAWRYRNYVIDSFNADKPYDEFLREQIAGDILALQGPPEKYAERITATGFLAISRRFGFDSENYHHLTIQDTTDTLGQSVLGLSLGCARCHDHKFDPVSMEDYYALYGIFDSSRYAFPGSEQKQKVRSLVPLAPPAVSVPKWREFERQVAALSAELAQQKRAVPSAVLRSLHDMDGDFELQAPAAGGSNGVLVPPWLYEGKIAVTNAAQSPFQNLFPAGRVGASIAADAGRYRICQAIHPRRTASDTERVFVNLDFRVGGSSSGEKGAHRLALGGLAGVPAVEILIAADTVSLRSGSAIEIIGTLPSGQWQNLQLTLDLKNRTVSGRFGAPGNVTQFADKGLASSWEGALELVVLDSGEESDLPRPAIELDNLSIQDAEIPAVTKELPANLTSGSDLAVLTGKLQSLTGIDGDFELQAEGSPPANPWGPGPNSVVKLSAGAQSPFANVYAPGTLGIHMPNRGDYDGFGQSLANVKASADGKLFASFDFRCANQDRGGDGSWRFYLGHGPGNSAAVELFFSGREFFRRSGEARDVVGNLKIGQWYQVQLILDLPAKTYTGTLAWEKEKLEFSGAFASGWDGVIDYWFIDSYGHIGGVRPALDADNFALQNQAIPPLDSPAKSREQADEVRKQVAELRQKITFQQGALDEQAQGLQKLLVDGPLPLAYGVSEGTPHSARIHKRGEPDQLGDVVARGFIKVLGNSSLPQDAKGSGRLELAHWLTRPENPLTARVMANRIWQYHFGRGLVQTPNDFGSRGLPPTDPELLDHLATEFVRNGWSIKSLHRLIMLSTTYQQGSAAGESREADTSDLYAGFPRRRLAAEEIRDAILLVSGTLDQSPAEGHPFPVPISWGFTQHGPFQAVYDHDRRSVYLMTQRLKRHPFLALFDGADPNASTPDRLETTVPTQALYFLNDPLVHAKAEAWATKLMADRSGDHERIDRAWQQAYSRLPTEAERNEGEQFLAAYRTELTAAGADRIEWRALAAYLRTMIASNEFLHVD